jgi:16S rRNA processing protein RimM
MTLSSSTCTSLLEMSARSSADRAAWHARSGVSCGLAGPDHAGGTCSTLPADPESLVPIGRVGRPHGVDGAFVVEGASAEPDRFAVGSRLLVDGEEATVIASRLVGKGRRAIALDRPVERGAVLAIRRSDLPPPAAGSYYVADLVGLRVLDADGTEIGVVTDVLPGVANDVLELDTGALLPLVEACLREIDLTSKRILLNPGFTD